MKRVFVFALLGALVLPLGGARADEGDCAVSIDSAGPDSPHLSDPLNDWNGAVTGNQSGVPSGDLYREGTDVTAAWMARNAETGVLEAHIAVQNLSALQVNSIFYFLWNYDDARTEDPYRAHRWASARFKGTTTVYTYGYFGELATGRGFVTMGDTTGRLVEGANGEIVIDLPKGGTTLDDRSANHAGEIIPNDEWGDPLPGSTISLLPGVHGDDAFGAESRLLAGSPERLPPPSPVGHGFVVEVDIPDNAHFICDALV